MYTIGEISKRFGLSRSTLLYYDSIGLLSPSGRSGANYRLYSEQDVTRMEKICLYREAGLPLEKIGCLLDDQENSTKRILESQLKAINRQIAALRNQQQVILRLLGSEEALTHSRAMTKERWINLLAATGLSEEDMNRWHAEFEKLFPEAHQDFLESLGINRDEITLIRQYSRENATRNKNGQEQADG